MTIRIQHNNKGLGLASAIVGTFMLGILLVAGMKWSTQMEKTTLHRKYEAEWLELQTHIRNQFDCTKSVAAIGTSCNSALQVDNFAMNLRNAANVIFVPAIIGQYNVKATCTGKVGGTEKPYAAIRVLARREVGGVPVADPLTKKTSEWTDLYGGIPLPTCLLPPSTPPPPPPPPAWVPVNGQVFLVRFRDIHSNVFGHVSACVKFDKVVLFTPATGDFSSSAAVIMKFTGYASTNNSDRIRGQHGCPAGDASFTPSVFTGPFGYGQIGTMASCASVTVRSCEGPLSCASMRNILTDAEVYKDGCQFSGTVTSFDDVTQHPTAFPSAQLIYRAP